MPNHIQALIRIAHPNLCRGMQHGLSGFARKSRQVDGIAYDEHHQDWLGLNGGKNPSLSYREFVEEGLSGVPLQALS